MKILITGGAGFIGSNFVRYQLERHPEDSLVVLDKLTYCGHLENLEGCLDRLRFVQGDIASRRDVEGALWGCQALVNFAAETHVDRSILDAGAFVQTDVSGTYQLLEAARRQGLSRFVQVSTDEVYGDAPGRPNREGDDLRPKSPYAASKAGADRLAFAYHETYGVPVVISRCSNNLGPRQFPEKLIPVMFMKAMRNEALPVYGNGSNTRDWVWVEDHCRALDLLLRSPGIEGEVFNVGSGEERSSLEVSKGILKRLGKPETLLSFVADRPGHVRRHAVESTKIFQRLGFKYKVGFEEALDRTVRWYQANGSWLKTIQEKSAGYKAYLSANYGRR